MKTLRKQYVAPTTVQVPVNGDGLMAIASPSKHAPVRNAGIDIVSAYSDDEAEEKSDCSFAGTGL